MYQYFTSHIPLRELYKCSEDYPFIQKNYKRVVNLRKYSELERKFDYIIEYKKVRDDDNAPCDNECDCCKVKRIFHKGSKDKFNRIEFDINFNFDITTEKATSVMQNRKFKGVLCNRSNNNQFYWQCELKVDKDNYIISSCDNEDGKECDYIYYPNTRFNKIRSGIRKTIYSN